MTTLTSGEHIQALFEAAETCEKILAGDPLKFKELLSDGRIKAIEGRWLGPQFGTADGRAKALKPEDVASLDYRINTAFFLIMMVADTKGLEAPLKAKAGALRERAARAIDNGDHLPLDPSETIAAAKVLEFSVRMRLGQLEYITDAFRDAENHGSDAFMRGIAGIEATVLELKNSLGHANGGSFGIRNPAVPEEVRETWRLSETLKKNPDFVIPAHDLLELSA